MKYFPVLFAALMLALPVSAQRFVKTVNTVADLVALNPNDIHNVVTIKWKTAEGTADEGDVFYYSAVSVLATNTTTVFKPNNFNGRWIRGNAAAAGSGTPGAPLGSLQFNQAGAFAGLTNSTLQAHTNLLSLGWPVYNVKNFGAIGDGSTDDTTSIQTALNAVQSTTRPARLYLPAGLYRTTASINITNSNVQVFGDGMANSVIRVTASGIGQAFLVNNSAARLFNVHFSGLRIEGTNGLASLPDGIKFANVSESSVSDCYGTGLNNGVKIDACEIVYVTHSTFSGIRSNGVYNTVVDASGFGTSDAWIDRCNFYQTTNASWLIDGPFSKGGVVNSWLESTPAAVLLENRATRDVEIDTLTIFNNNFQNVTGSGFEGGRFVLARANGVTNYFIIHGLNLTANKSTSTGASNTVEFIKGSNTNANTTAHNTRIVGNMFAGVSVSAIYSDTALRIHTSDNWIQSGLPETSGSVVPRWFSPPLISMQDTNRVEQSILQRTAGNDIQDWSFSTNSGKGYIVFDNTKSFYWDVGNNGNDMALSAGLLAVSGQGAFTGNFDTAGQINAGSENRNITTAAGRVDIDQFSTNTALVNYVPTFDGANVVWAAQLGGGGATNAAGSATEVQFRNGATGAFAADTDFQYDSTNNVLDVTSTVRANKFQGTNQFKLISGGTNAIEVLNAAGNTVLLFEGVTRSLTVGQSNTLSSTPHINGDIYSSVISLYPRTNTGTAGAIALFGQNGNSISIAPYLGGLAQESYEISYPSNAPSGSGVQLIGFSNGVPRFVDATATTGNYGDMFKARSNLVTGSVTYQMVAAQVVGVTNVVIDSNTNIVFHNITTNFALVFTNWSNNTGEKKIIITEDSTGGHAPAVEADVLWENSPSTTHAAIPSFPTNAGVSYTLTAYRRNGTNWIRGPSTIALSAATTSALFGTGVGTDPAFRAIADADVPNTITIDNATAAQQSTNVVVIDSTDTTAFFGIFDSATGVQQPKTDAGATYNASTGAASFTSLLEGANAVPNVTDNLGVFAATTSAQLAGVTSDESGTGVFLLSSGNTQTNAALSTPVITSPAVTWNVTDDPSSNTTTNWTVAFGGGTNTFEFMELTQTNNIFFEFSTNRAPVRSLVILLNAGGSIRTNTINSNWKRLGTLASPFTVTNGTKAVLSLTAFGGGDSGVSETNVVAALAYSAN